MTLPQNVADALGELEAAHDQRFAPWRNQWQTIRAHLLSQDAEIELLRVGCERNLLHAQMDESRLAAAYALLRECRRLAAHFFKEAKPGDLYERIDAHLSENTHDRA